MGTQLIAGATRGATPAGATRGALPNCIPVTILPQALLGEIEIPPALSLPQGHWVWFADATRGVGVMVNIAGAARGAAVVHCQDFAGAARGEKCIAPCG